MAPPPLDKWDIVLGKTDDITMGTRVWKMICDLETIDRKQKFLAFRRQIAEDTADNTIDEVHWWMEQSDLRENIESKWILEPVKSLGDCVYQEVTEECALLGISKKQKGPTRLQLKVFQASPLAYENMPIPFLDLDEEESILKEALKDTHIDVSFEVATVHGISTFLAQGQSFLHLSCHGSPQQLFIEDGYGGCHLLEVGENLQRWITVGGQRLHFVFVSACHSRSVGEAFRDAGVPYVVCCQQDGHQLLDQAARIFARGFYTHVAQGLAIAQAYEQAKNDVIQAPEIRNVAGIVPENEAKKFVLLTKTGTYNDADTTTNAEQEQVDGSQPVQGAAAAVSFRRHSTILSRRSLRDDRLKAQLNKLQSSDPSESTPTTTMLPVPPQPFLERELAMYQILKAFFKERRKVRLVRIEGEKGIGKVSLAKAVAQYVKKRNMWGPILWLPPLGGHGSTNLFKSSIAQAILENYSEEKALLILDATKFSQEDLTSLCRFLDDLFERTKYVKVIVIQSTNRDRVIVSQRNPLMGFLVPEKRIELQPLNVEASAFLFCHSCPHALAWFKTKRILQQKAENDENAAFILGFGNPTKILLMAQNMSKLEFDKLMEANAAIHLEDFSHSLNLVDESMAASEQSGLTRQTSTSSRSSASSHQSFDLRNVMLHNDELPPPLRTQEEIIDRFVDIFHDENRVYRKMVRSFIRKAVQGEHIVSIINGIPTTEQSVEDDSSWVVCGEVAGEFYIIHDDKFKTNYDTEHPASIAVENEYLHKQGYKAYQKTGQVYAHKVDESDMDFFRCGSSATTKEAHFMAPWETPIRVELGDYLVLQYGCYDDIYRIDCNLFKRSYADIDQSTVSRQQANDLRARTLSLKEQMTEYQRQNPNFSKLEGDIRLHLDNLMGVLDQAEQGVRKPDMRRGKTT